MVLAAPGPLLTPPSSSSPPKTPIRSYSAQTPARNGNPTTPLPGGRGGRRPGRGTGGQNRPQADANALRHPIEDIIIIKPSTSLWTQGSPLAVKREERGDRDEALDRRPSAQLESRPRRTVDREAPRGMTPLQKLEVEKRPERVCKERASENNDS